MSTDALLLVIAVINNIPVVASIIDTVIIATVSNVSVSNFYYKYCCYKQLLL